MSTSVRHSNRQSGQSRREEKKSKTREVSRHAHVEVQLAPVVRAKNEFQSSCLNAIKTKDAVFINAPAGTGKTFLVMSTVSDWLKSQKIDKIILSRPTVGMGNSIGLLPGSVRDKFEPYLAALVQVLVNRYGAGYYETQLSNKNIEFVPLEYIRGRSFENAVVIIDEFQNTDAETAYTIMTRLGEGSKMFCLGDVTQNDLRGNKESGLDWAIDFIDRHDLTHIADFIDGTSEDIVRSPFCKAVVKAREKDLRLS